MRQPHSLIRSALLLACLAVVCPSPSFAQMPSRRPKHITTRAENMIHAKLDRLVAIQQKDGSWRSGRSHNGGYDVAMTGLAGVALLMGGNTPQGGRHVDAVNRAIDFLLASQGSNGLFATPNSMNSATHGHGFAIMFLGLCYGMDADDISRKRLGEALNLAIGWSTRAQSKNGGWFYYADKGNDEGSTTVTQIQGLRACRNAGLDVPVSVINNAAQYLKICQQADGGICYSFKSRGQSRPSISAAAVATLYSAGEYDNPVALHCLSYLRKHLRTSGYSVKKAFSGHSYYGSLYASQAMWFAGEKDWDAYFPNVRDFLLGQAVWNGDSVGESYGTAIGLIIMQLPYERVPIFQR